MCLLKKCIHPELTGNTAALKNFTNSKIYLEPSQASCHGIFFAKIVNGYKAFIALWKGSVFGVFWFVFSRIRTECGEILPISPYSVRMRENTDQKNSKYGHFSRSVPLHHRCKSSIIDVWLVSKYASAWWNPYLVKTFFDPQFHHLTNIWPRYCKMTKLLKRALFVVKYMKYLAHSLPYD